VEKAIKEMRYKKAIRNDVQYLGMYWKCWEKLVSE